MELSAQFDITGWDEEPFDSEAEGGRLTRADVTRTFHGDITGDSVVTYLMAYAEDGTATFVGVERIRGSFADRRGSLVLEHTGTFRDGAARATVRVAPGTGTQDLASAAGEGDFVADPSGSVRLDLSFDEPDA